MPEKQENPKIIPHLYLLVATIVLLLLIWYTIDIFLLLFAGILLAIVIRSFSHLISQSSGLSSAVSVTLVLFSMLLFLTILIFIMAPSITKQVSQLYTELPEAWDKFRDEFLSFINWKEIKNAPVVNSKNIAANLGGFFTTTFGFFGNVFVILFFGIALAYQPRIYTRGFVILFSKKNQDTVKDLLNRITSILRFWLAGKALSMLAVGLLTWLGLWLLNMPLAFTLALLAALLSFIPNIGPIISAIPSVLLALLKSPVFALYVVILYIVVQMIESYLITPLIQQKSISLPPALIIFMQLIMSLIVGFLGLALATPLLAVISVVVDQIYIKKKRNFSKQDQ